MIIKHSSLGKRKREYFIAEKMGFVTSPEEIVTVFIVSLGCAGIQSFLNPFGSFASSVLLRPRV